MSFRGLDFGTGINQYSNLIRQSYVDRENRLRQQEQDRQALFKAGQSGYDVGEDMFTTIANPGITEAEVMEAAGMNQFSTTGRGPAGGASPPQMAPMGQQPAGDSQNLLDLINQYQGPEREQLMEMYYRQNPKSIPGEPVRDPSGVEGPLASYGPNNPYPAQRQSTQDMISGLQNSQQGISNINQAAGRDQAANPQPPMRGSPLSSKALKEFEAKMRDLEAIKARRSKSTGAPQEGASAQEVTGPQEGNFIKNMVLEGLVSGRAKMDTNGRILVHPELAAQIKEMKMLQFKNSMKSGESSLFNTLLEKAFNQKDPVPPRPLAKRNPPSLRALDDMLKGLQSSEFSVMMAGGVDANADARNKLLGIKAAYESGQITAEQAYSQAGMLTNASQKQVESKMINGQRYEKVNGGWKPAK